MPYSGRVQYGPMAGLKDYHHFTVARVWCCRYEQETPFGSPSLNLAPKSIRNKRRNYDKIPVLSPRTKL